MRVIVRAISLYRPSSGFLNTNLELWLIHLFARQSDGHPLVRVTYTDCPFLLTPAEKRDLGLDDAGVGMGVYPEDAEEHLEWCMHGALSTSSWITPPEAVLSRQIEVNGRLVSTPVTSQIFLQHLSQMLMWLKCRRTESSKMMECRLSGFIGAQNEAWADIRQAADGLAASLAVLEGGR